MIYDDKNWTFLTRGGSVFIVVKEEAFPLFVMGIYGEYD